ncbi:GPI-anchored protein LLG1-like [Macadamia integrifolia]|uniref:GPI-anchored protein LLG1-like n=1 Tax=Macadamia integrifolia TaxID=60698 RepID=UPI001C4F607C|nr:GPI-anchored protein LLG1-like [Macadamia integrifolia]
MSWNHCLFATLFFLSTSLASSSFIFDNVFESDRSTGWTARTLLQAKKSCSVNFEFLNYTIITSQCKGPQYPAKQCCGALKEFACPYSVQLNDLTTDCASTMFSYINLYGKYPPGLFSSECHDSKLGLVCDATAPAESVNANGAWIGQTVPQFLVLLAGSLVVLIQML